MKEKEFIKLWQKKVKENKIHELFQIGEYDLWDFFEPLILGNSGFHHFFGFLWRYKRASVCACIVIHLYYFYIILLKICVDLIAIVNLQRNFN